MGELSEIEACVNLLKSIIGLGVLTLPFATAQVGILTSLVGFGVVAFVNFYGIVLATSALSYTLEQDHEAVGLNPQAVPKESILGAFDHVLYRALGTKGRVLACSCVVLCQWGTGVSYIRLIADSISTYFPHRDVKLQLMVGICFILILLSAVKTLKGIAFLSFLGLLTYMFLWLGLVCIASEKIADGSFGDDAVMVNTIGANLGVWFGLSSFAFGGFNIAIVVHADMKKGANFERALIWAFTICLVFYAAVASLGYACFGEHTQEIIYLNFVGRPILRHGSLITICVVLLFTYVLQMYPVYYLVQQSCDDWFVGSIHYSIVRTVLIIISVVVAYLLPSLTFILDLIGACCGNMIGLLLPALVFLLLTRKPSYIECFLAFLLVAIASLGMLRTIGL